MSSYVWVQLYIKGEDKPRGLPFDIESPRNNSALAEAVKAKLRNQLFHVDANELEVYENVNLNGLEINLKNATLLRAAASAPTGTTDEKPLIVAAPPPLQQQIARNSMKAEPDEMTMTMSKASFDFAQKLLEGRSSEQSEAWDLHPEEDVKAWRDSPKDSEELKKLRTLPTEPFPVTADDRPRYELGKKFVKRECFDTFETAVKKAARTAIDGGKAAAISVLGAKGAGKSVFFRYFLYKHCTERLVVYVPNAGTITDIYRKLMDGVLFGLQCCNHADAKEMLCFVRSSPKLGELAHFRALWSGWRKRFVNLCGEAYILIDQLQRKGDLFSALRDVVIDHCAAYVLISSTGILHHHNVSSVFKKLVYIYPVRLSELAAIDEGKKLGNIREVTTMLRAIRIMEGQDNKARWINDARTHYEHVKKDGHLGKLLATVQSQEINEPIDGGIWEEVLDPNHLYVDVNKMVTVVVDDEYMVELRKLLTSDKVNYKQILRSLLADQDIVNEVGNAALGVHVEALLDTTWQELGKIEWSQERALVSPSGGDRSSRSRGSKNIAPGEPVEFNNIQTVCFDGYAPSEVDLQGLDLKRPVYFKPRMTNYPGFDMFVLSMIGLRWCFFALQVTVKNAKDHGLEAFDTHHREAWDELLQLYLKKTMYEGPLEWRFYMLTPEDDPSKERPSSVHEDIPVFQVSFMDLVDCGNLSCGIKAVKDFVLCLEIKRQSSKRPRVVY